jgi:hypothetical protein
LNDFKGFGLLGLSAGHPADDRPRIAGDCRELVMAEKTLTVKVEAALWSQLLKLKSERASLEVQIEEIQKQLDLPSGSMVADMLGLGFADKARIIIVDGNNDQRGKGSVSYVAPTKVPDPRWQARYS